MVWEVYNWREVMRGCDLIIPLYCIQLPFTVVYFNKVRPLKLIHFNNVILFKIIYVFKFIVDMMLWSMSNSMDWIEEGLRKPLYFLFYHKNIVFSCVLIIYLLIVRTACLTTTIISINFMKEEVQWCVKTEDLFTSASVL